MTRGDDSAGPDGPRGATASPRISLPKGGGALRGIGEKLAVDAADGAAGLSVPVPLSPGRSGFGPELMLSYSSGAGNGPFGLGWSLSTPRITRKTDKGLPQYRDGEESDVFILSGAEDLVPVRLPDGSRFEDRTTSPQHVIHRYRPRIEGLFARIERWTHVGTGAIHWRTITRDNVTTLYGTDDSSRIYDPDDPSPASPTRIFSWLIRESRDDKGNAILYEHVAENDANVDRNQACEANRARPAGRYLKRIKYGNRTSCLLAPDLADAPWLFEAVFDYDEGHVEDAPLDPAVPEAAQHRYVRASTEPGRPWAVRPDAFSSYRSGFEVRSYRRCRRILMFHHVPDASPDDPGYDGLVRALELDYDDLDPAAAADVDAELAHQGATRYGSLLRRITQSGYVKAVAGEGGAPLYLKRSLPPLELEYSRPVIDEQIRELDAASAENLPVGLDGADYQWADLDGAGVSGALVGRPDAWRYKQSLGGGRLGPLETLGAAPAGADLARGSHQLLDLAGDGRLDVVALAGPAPGFFERAGERGWETLRTFPHAPNIRWDDPNLRLVDLTGDGRADILVTEDEALVWRESLGEEGFGPARRVRAPPDEEQGPRLVFGDGEQSIYLADMSADGLTDLVRIRNGEACYWPNLGYGRFGAKVTMDNAPWLDHPDQFEPARVRLVDIDGSGPADLVYLGRDGVRLYFNQSGNRWSAARPLAHFPRVDNLAAIATVDLLGAGTACLVWSSPLPGEARRPLRYVDLMRAGKPHLLVRIVNNMGAETRVAYAPSTKFHLTDAAAGRPWVTRLPFAVHVVERVETLDQVSGNRFVSRYAYHHGFFDGVEREFRGFGLVEQLDTEEFAALAGAGDAAAGTNIDAASHVPPVLTKTWFHTGVYFGRSHVSDFFAGLLDERDLGEYHREPGLDDEGARALLLDDTVLPEGLSPDEEREAARALKGGMLRREVYALDGTEKAGRPYAVTERSFTIRVLQRRHGGRHAVFFTHSRETLSYHYERALVAVRDGMIVPDAAPDAPDVVWRADPRVTHTLTLEVDDFGNVLRSASVGYGRRAADPRLDDLDRATQERTLATLTESRFTRSHETGEDAIDTADAYRAPLPAESRTYELTGLAPSAGRPRLTFEEVRAAADTAAPIPYEATPQPGAVEKRLVRHARTYYRRDDLSGPLPLGALEPLALPYESYSLALTPGLLDSVYGGRVSEAMLEAEGGYVRLEGEPGWWRPSGRVFYSPDPEHGPSEERAEARAHFFLPRRFRDPFHTDATSTDSFVVYDAFDLLVRETRDALDNRVTAGERPPDAPDGTPQPARGGLDYRVLQPALVMDPNRNRAAVVFDALGLVVATAVMGKPEGPPEGDRISPALRADLTEAETDAFLASPDAAAAAALLEGATTRFVYDLGAHGRGRGPAFAASIARERHESDPARGEGGGPSRLQIAFSYSDGFGREIQKKTRAAPGRVPARDDAGALILGADGRPVATEGVVAPRWVGSGWTVFNNKGDPVRRYEPFFTDTHRFERDVRIGVSPVLFYNPVGRVVATLHPDHTWEKVVFDPWRRESWDVSDTAAIADPAADPDVGGFFARLPDADHQPTWRALRLDPTHAAAFASRYPDPADRAAETEAARRTDLHAGTPSVAYADALGRGFLTVAHNRLRYSDTAPADPPVEEHYRTRVVLDIVGAEREVIDAAGRLVMRTDYDMTGARLREASMEAGERWMLADVSGQPLYVWDSRGHRQRIEYDPLRRPVRTLVLGADPDQPARELLTERRVYGEQHPDAVSRNLRAALYLQLDQSGATTTDGFDFKGNPTSASRLVATEYKRAIDWRDADAALPADPTAPFVPAALEGAVLPLMEADVFTTRTAYDALNRPVTVLTPDGSVVRPGYDEGGRLERVEADLPGAPSGTVFVAAIDYDAQGRRERIVYGNGAETSYAYDPLTFRLARLVTRRDATAFPDDSSVTPGGAVQDLRYTYDPAGDITSIRDGAQQAIFFRNQRVEPSAEYVYDAVHRLIEATGREHLSQAGGAPIPHAHDDARRSGLLHPGDGTAMGRYRERYVYDTVGNILEMQHRGSDPAHPGWTRRYAYEEASLLEPGARSNRLSRTQVGNGVASAPEAYGYDAHGNMLAMPHLQAMAWDWKDQLRMTRRQAVDAADADGEARQGERTWHVYDAGGARVRKVTERADGAIKDERIYLGGFEVYRRHGASPLVRETLHVMDDARRIALVETRVAGEEPGVPARLVRYQHSNHLGSASLELDEQARVVSYEEYSPYGSTTYRAARGQAEAGKRYRFTGKERDEESGLYYHGARYYAPWVGRWVSCDPAGLVDGVNLFAYTGNRPTNRIDPQGTQGHEGAAVMLGRWPDRPPVLEPGQVWPPAGRSPISLAPELRLHMLEGLGIDRFVNLHDVIPGISPTHPSASGTAVRSLLANSDLDIYFDLRGLDELLDMTLAERNVGALQHERSYFHSLEEWFAIERHLAEGGTYKGNIILRHADDTYSQIRAGTTEIAPLDPWHLLQEDFGKPMSMDEVIKTFKGLSKAKKLGITLGVTATVLGPLADVAEAAPGSYHIGAGIEAGPATPEGAAHFLQAKEGFGSLSLTSGASVVLFGGGSLLLGGVGMMAGLGLLASEAYNASSDLSRATRSSEWDLLGYKHGKRWRQLHDPTYTSGE